MPTLGQYMAWLRSVGGEARCGVATDIKIGMVPCTKLISPDGYSAVLAGLKQRERLSRFTVQYLDRRLRMNSPWAHADVQ